MGQVLPFWFGFSRFNELLSCCEFCAVPSSIHEEGPITSVALLLSAPLSGLCMQCRHPTPCRPPCSCSLPPLDTSFPEPGWVASEAGEGPLPLLEGCNRLCCSHLQETRCKPKSKQKRDCLFHRRDTVSILAADGWKLGRYARRNAIVCLPFLYIYSHIIATTSLLETGLLHRWTFDITIYGCSYDPLIN